MKIRKGNIIKCEVTGITDYGVFVKTDKDYSGLIHISELSNGFVNNIDKLYIIGDIIEAKVLDIDVEKKQLKLSIKKSNNKNSIVEKGSGFKPLKKNITIWIKDKLNELSKSSKTP